MEGTTIFSDFLKSLGVPHTGEYSDDRFHQMPFKSLFGFSRLLTEYGIPNEALNINDKNCVADIQVPFIAYRPDGFVIVDDIRRDADGKPAEVTYNFYHTLHTCGYDEFIDSITGTVLRAYPGESSSEPDYCKNHLKDLISQAKRWLLALLTLILAVAGFIHADIGRHNSLILLLATDIAGLYVTFLLMQKTVKVSSHTADKVCGILQVHGCDTVLAQKASTFFGIVSWSEVGMAYFAMSTIILFAFPDCIHYLALINGCCLPFTVWSIWYQRFRIHAWCTLCVVTQTLLWLQFFCFFLGDWWSHIFPLRIELFVMITAYGALLLLLNGLNNFIKSRSRIPLN
ncbi:MAG: vitamin K epoxide reductase family protein [Muribaculaceae bacterium]|nr:vitamin K epoxide reductase family protein [Muribaculaceae bacterium]